MAAPYPTVNTAQKQDELHAAGLPWPVCDCHGWEKKWSVAKTRPAGGHWVLRCKANANNRRHSASDKGRERYDKYNASDKGRERFAKYSGSAKGLITKAAHYGVLRHTAMDQDQILYQTPKQEE